MIVERMMGVLLSVVCWRIGWRFFFYSKVHMIGDSTTFLITRYQRY